MQEQHPRDRSSVIPAAKNTARRAVPGAMHGAALFLSQPWLYPAVIALILPLLLLAMLPTVIFGPFSGDGTGSANAFVDDAVLVENMLDLHTSLRSSLSEGLEDVLERIDANFASSGCDIREIHNPYGSDPVYNANAIISMYCAGKALEIERISLEDITSILRRNKDKLYSFTYHDEVRFVEGEIDPVTKEPAVATVTVRIYSVQYNGEAYLENAVFGLTEEQKLLAGHYAQNLTVLLGDGVYQVLTDDASPERSYEGVVFTDGVIPVTYFNQLDRRWCSAPYGTDHIGGYACGPTAMAIVISSLTTQTVDPPHMAQWAFENHYWCSGSGSYHTLIPGAAKAWRLRVEGCSAAQSQTISDALADGKLVVALMNKGHFTSSGHFIVLRGVTPDGHILVADPSCLTRSTMEWDLELILNEASKRAGAGGPFWIIG